jgi:outer membrane receptor protein involved in Fe transport
VRLSAPLGDHFEWLVGGFYTHEDSRVVQNIFALSPGSGAIAADGAEIGSPSIYAESAAFADLTLHTTERFDVQLGGRWSSISQTLQENTYAPLLGVPSPVVGQKTYSSADPVTYLLTPRYKLSQDLMVYARIASGYRPGGSNGPLCQIYGFSCQYAPDKTKNYEIGAKGTVLDRVLSYDVSVYYIDWKNIQLHTLLEPEQIGYETNASAAKSQGVELSLEAKPLRGLTASAWVVWNEAELTQSFPDGAAYGVPGGRLPYSSRWSGNLSVNQEFPLPGMTGFVGASLVYVGDRLGGFTGATAAPAPREYLPAYARTDLHTGVRYDTWTVNLYVNNTFDKRGVLDTGSDMFPPSTLYIQPRTFGVTLSKVF